MGNIIAKIVIDLLIPISKNLLVYYLGKSNANKENKLKELEKLNDKLEDFNELVKKEKEIYEKYNDYTFDDIYDEWLYNKDTD